jgi:hypothetical protein
MFGYNGSNQDGDGSGMTYGTPPPAVGYHLLQGPIVTGSDNDSAFFRGRWKKGYKNLPMTSFAPIVKHWFAGTCDPMQGDPEGGKQMYNNMKGYRTWDGEPTTFALCGDPIAGTGWYETWVARWCSSL